jgi:excisionase family DNA binding protein
MGISKLKVPKVCEQCGKIFPAKTVVTRFCSHACNLVSNRRKKKQQEQERRQQILQQSAAANKAASATVTASNAAETPNPPNLYLSIPEAVKTFGISKDTIRRLIRAGKIPAVNLGIRLTRISRPHIEAMFTAVPLPEQKPREQERQPLKLHYEPHECYTIGEVSEKFGVSPTTVRTLIRRNSIPKRQFGNFVYVPKIMIDKILTKK